MEIIKNQSLEEVIKIQGDLIKELNVYDRYQQALKMVDVLSDFDRLDLIGELVKAFNIIEYCPPKKS